MRFRARRKAPRKRVRGIVLEIFNRPHAAKIFAAVGQQVNAMAAPCELAQAVLEIAEKAEVADGEEDFHVESTILGRLPLSRLQNWA